MSANTPEENKPQVDLDLNAVAPAKSITVLIGDKVIEIQPFHINDIIRIQKLARESSDPNSMETVMEGLKPLAPDLEAANPTPQQLRALLDFIVSSQGQKKGA